MTFSATLVIDVRSYLLFWNTHIDKYILKVTLCDQRQENCDWHLNAVKKPLPKILNVSEYEVVIMVNT